MKEFPPLISFDLETTGLDPLRDRIIEIGAVRWEAGQETASYSSLLRYNGALSPSIKRLTGIDEEELQSAPEPEEVLADFQDFTAGGLLLAHNATFDHGFLKNNGCWYPEEKVLCSLELSRIFLPLAPSHALEELVRELQLQADRSHRALDDARSAGLLFWELWRRCLGEPWELILQMARVPLPGTGLGTFLNLLTSQGLQSFGQQKVPARFGITLGPEEELENAERPDYRLDAQEIDGWLSPAGPLKDSYPFLEERQAQKEMLKAVCRSFNQGEYLVVEAGTGTGKSLAYLLPALFWAKNTGQKVVVATNTIHLQEQLWQKDIPILKQAVPGGFRAALLKGRSNYLCLRKWEHQWNQAAHNPGAPHLKFLLRLLNWLKVTVTGDQAELGLNRDEAGFWPKVASESESCLGHKCRWFGQECFLQRARKKAEKAQLLIINHSLLLSDLVLDNQILPTYRRLIIDEAHHLPAEATKHMTKESSLRRLERIFDTSGLTGRDSLSRWKKIDTLEDKLFRLEQSRAQLLKKAREFYSSLERLPGRGSFDDQGGQTVRLTAAVLQSEWWQDLLLQAENLSGAFQDLEKALDDFRSGLELLDEDLTEDIQDLFAARQHITGFARELAFILAAEEDNYVYWAELNPRDPRDHSLKAAPLEVGPYLTDLLYQELDSAVFTSATLTVGGSFAYFLEGVGLNLLAGEQLKTIQLDSPFFYAEQALLLIDPSAPDPTSAGDAQTLDFWCEALLSLILAAKGKTLVLFTAHRALRQCAHRLRQPLARAGIDLLAQGLDGSREQIIRRFSLGSASVIFGASSFWEGVDLPGDLLRQVIITRLPFQSPGLPTVAGRSDLAAKRGKNPFQTYQLPEAVIRLKQGFGRLIRTSLDQGCVVILDPRITTKRYGKTFLASLPPARVVTRDLNSLLPEIKAWLPG